MLVRSKAPLRLGLAGGGTDVSPYSEIYGGAILNATINKYSFCTIEPLSDRKIAFMAIDRNERFTCDAVEKMEIDGHLDLLKGVYNRVVKDFVHKPLSFSLSTYVDAPPGSGLGSSSTLVVAILGAFVEWLKLPLGDYDIAHLAYEIERVDLAMAGGKQDQYAATFGGFNFVEFYDNDRVVVNPLRIRQELVNELEMNFVLYYTGTSRLSSKIIEDQSKHTQKSGDALDSMHKVKQQSYMMKEAILKGEFNKIGDILDFGWKHKKATSSSISNTQIEKIYDIAKKAGATGGKISGAGGGGFFLFFCPDDTRYGVKKALALLNGNMQDFQFTQNGLMTWSV